MTDDAKLLPCPFCGSDDIDAEFALVAEPDGRNHHEPGCMECGATAPANLWNKALRAPSNVMYCAKEREECWPCPKCKAVQPSQCISLPPSNHGMDPADSSNFGSHFDDAPSGDGDRS